MAEKKNSKKQATKEKQHMKAAENNVRAKALAVPKKMAAETAQATATQAVKKKGEKVYVKPKKPAAVKKKQEALRKKKQHPLFRGRFGNKNVRRISKERWQRWRKPKGMDIVRRREDGALPMSGYGNDARIRDLHPSGYAPQRVSNVQEIMSLHGHEEKAAIIAAGVGKKKKREMLKKAHELGIAVLNRGA